jgi:hypothetical protein
MFLIASQRPPPEPNPAMRMTAGSKFAYSAGLVPWSDSGLDDLHKVWLQASAPLTLPEGGVCVQHPRITYIQALRTHVEAIVALPDKIRERGMGAYKALCTVCGCANKRELTEVLAVEAKPRGCPISRLLRACGQLGTKILRPRALTEAVRSREASWQALRTYLRNRVAGGPQACCGLCGSGWRLECDAEAAAEARHQVPQPAGVGRTRDPMIHPVCLLPTTIARYPQWLSPLHLVLTQVNLRDLFPRVDRGAHPAPVPVHQELIQQVLSTLRSEASLQPSSPTRRDAGVSVE